MNEGHDEQKEELKCQPVKMSQIMGVLALWFTIGQLRINKQGLKLHLFLSDGHIDSWVSILCLSVFWLTLSWPHLYGNPLSVSVVPFSLGGNKKKSRHGSLLTALPIILSHHSTVVLSFKHKAVNSVAPPIQTPHIPSVVSVCCFFSAGGTCSHIPLPEHGSNTNKVVGGERMCVCICAKGCLLLCVCVPSCCPCRCYTGTLDSVCVIEILYKVISTLSDRFNLCSWF